MSYTEEGLRRPPRAPIDLIWVGVGLAVLGGALLGIGDDAALLGIPVLCVAGIVGWVGIIGQGVLMGTRAANHEEYLHQLIEEGADDGESA